MARSAAVLTVARMAATIVHTSAQIANMCEKERIAQIREMRARPATIGCRIRLEAEGENMLW